MNTYAQRIARRASIIFKVGAVALPLAACAAQLDESGEVAGLSAALTSSETPYLEGLSNQARFTALLTVGDSVNNKPDGVTPYRLVGLGDGLGAYGNGDGTFTVLMNHELGATAGIPREHDGRGSFVSKWIINRQTLDVLHGEDLIKTVKLYDSVTGTWNTTAGVAFARFCSADLALQTAFYNPLTNKGTKNHIFMNGEETGNEGRAFAHIVDGPEAGTSYELPHVGKLSFENSVAHPNTGDSTVVVSTDDAGNGQLYVYVGTKKNVGDTIERAGLTGGLTYGVKVDGLVNESDATVVAPGTRFALEPMGDVSGMTGATLQANSVAQGVSGFQRPEDAAWNPAAPNDLYFVTTASFTGRTRLWRLRFDNAADPTLGGTIEMLIDGGEPRMFDNITVSRDGKYVVLQEDPGNQDHLAKVWRYEIATGVLTLVAQHVPARFSPGGSEFITRDEESSGVIDLTNIVGPNFYLVVDQAHIANSDSELAERGQLLLMQMR